MNFNRLISIAIVYSLIVLCANLFMLVIKPDGPHAFPFTVMISTAFLFWLKFQRTKQMKIRE